METTAFDFSAQEQDVMRRLSVAALVLFGSQAQGKTNGMSDYDIGVLVKDKSLLYDAEKRKEIYDSLYDILSSHIQKIVDIDIVFLETAPAELTSHVMKYGKIIFEPEHSAFARFKERTMLQYADFAPLRKIFHEGVLAQIPS